MAFSRPVHAAHKLPYFSQREDDRGAKLEERKKREPERVLPGVQFVTFRSTFLRSPISPDLDARSDGRRGLVPERSVSAERIWHFSIRR